MLILIVFLSNLQMNNFNNFIAFQPASGNCALFLLNFGRESCVSGRSLQLWEHYFKYKTIMYALHWYETYTRSVQFKCFNFMLIILHTSSNKVFWLKISKEILFDWYFFRRFWRSNHTENRFQSVFCYLFYFWDWGRSLFQFEGLILRVYTHAKQNHVEHVQYNLIGNEINIYFKCFRCQRVFCAK